MSTNVLAIFPLYPEGEVRVILCGDGVHVITKVKDEQESVRTFNTAVAAMAYALANSGWLAAVKEEQA